MGPLLHTFLLAYLLTFKNQPSTHYVLYISAGNRLSRHPVSYLIPFVRFLLMLQIDDLEFPAFGFVEEMSGLPELELLGLVDGPQLVYLVVELEHDAVELADHLLDLLLKLDVLVPTIGIEEH